MRDFKSWLSRKSNTGKWKTQTLKINKIASPGNKMSLIVISKQEEHGAIRKIPLTSFENWS